jgi:hypothetical protein
VSLTATFPSYREAVDREQSERDLAFCGLPIPVCGIPCRLITPRIYSLLSNCECAFVSGARIRPEDVAMFLWFCSPHYSLDARERSLFVQHHVAKVNFEDGVRQILMFLEMNFADAPRGGGQNGKSYTSHIAAIVDLLAQEYGWRDDWILDMPLMRIYQYVRRIQMRNTPGAIMFNRSDKALSDEMARRNAAANN